MAGDAAPDPVERVAWILRDHRVAYNDPGPGEVCDDDRTAARRVLAALTAEPWHLVTFYPSRNGPAEVQRRYQPDDVAEVDEVYRP